MTQKWEPAGSDGGLTYTAFMEEHKTECVTLDPIEWPDIEPALTSGKPATQSKTGACIAS